MPILSDSDVGLRLEGLEGWSRGGQEIKKQFKLKNFIESVGFVNKIAILAEKADHHPDILIEYSKVTVTLSTHSEGGITEKDFNLAQEIEDLR